LKAALPEARRFTTTDLKVRQGKGRRREGEGNVTDTTINITTTIFIAVTTPCIHRDHRHHLLVI
jgi:hypothetical protein